MTSISFDVVQMHNKFKVINQVPQSCEASIHIMHQRSNMTSISFDVVQMRNKFKGINQVPRSCEASIHNTPNPNSQQRSIILLTSMKSLPCIKQLPF